MLKRLFCISEFFLVGIICFSSVELSGRIPPYDRSDQLIAAREDPIYGARNGAGEPLRTWDWDYKESWRSNRRAFFRGDTQPEAVEEDFLYVRPPGVGDPQDYYWNWWYQYYHRPLYDQWTGVPAQPPAPPGYRNRPDAQSYYQQNR